MNMFDFVRTLDRIKYLETKGNSDEGLTDLEQFELSRLYSMEIEVDDSLGDEDDM